jgi:hypothetical protein
VNDDPAAPARRAQGATAWLSANAALLLLYLALPRWRGALFAEDRLVETATAALFLAAFLIAAGALPGRAEGRYRWALPAAGLLALTGFLDEISFGARFTGAPMPALAGGGEFDGAHDLVVLAYRSLSAGQLALAGAAVVAAALALQGWSVARGHGGLRRGVRIVAADAAYRRLAAFAALLAAALVIDLDVGWLARLGAVEELCELNASAMLLSAVVAMGRPRPVRVAAAR